MLQDGKCIPKPICKTGEVLRGGKCPSPCREHFHLEHGTCVLDPNCHTEYLGIGFMIRQIIVCEHTVHGGGGGSGNSGGSHYVGSGSSSSLTQIPSKATDFPNNDSSAIQVHITSAKKDTIGSYHVLGEITRNGNTPIQNVMVTVHLYDANNGLVGVSTCCYTTPINIEPGHTATFDSFVQKSDYTGTPASFRLSYDWS
jgi:hypothetical protein